MGDDEELEMQQLIEGAVPVEFAGRSWEGFLHHVDFIVALMHVGTSLFTKNLTKVMDLVVALVTNLVTGLVTHLFMMLLIFV